MENYRQQAPFTVQIEPTEGCNLGCKFCGLRGMRENGTKPWYFMNTKTAENIAKKIKEAGWTCKIIFAMHGEPTLNPDLFKIISIFRKYLPNAVFYIISNGYGIVHNDEYEIEDYVKELFNAGINHILLDNYSDHGDWSKVVKAVQDTVQVLYLGKDKTPMFPTDSKKNIIVLPPIVTTKISLVRNLKNHCGAAFPLDDSFNNKKCAVPFRELSFRYDGSVALCCDDFRGEFFIGNIKDYKTIDDLWNDERFQAARIMLYNGERSFRPCQGCSSVSMRVGLLPDQKGKDELEPVSEEVRMFCQAVGQEGPLSKIIVKRPWEQ
jgi:radical SAM protein with 4Fe4S-binding SPASM domain